MISESTINAVRQLDIVQALSKYMKLDKKGSGYTGCCPLHNEKTPSFHVSQAKGFFKCFGCSEHGDVIAFVMKNQGYSFYEAIEQLSRDNNINIEYEINNNIPPEVREKKREEKATAYSLLQDATHAYQEALNSTHEQGAIKAKSYIRGRGFTEKTIKSFGLGFAPSGFNYLTDRELFKTEQAKKIGIEIGLLSQKNDKIFNTLINRVTFPINDERGAVVGFGARILESDSKFAKYVNSPESAVYDKSGILYGLDKARKSIQDYGVAVLVEGYTDVITMVQASWTNTVGTCGTALTETQAKILKKYCNTIFLMRDGDSAGKKATLRDIKILVAAGFIVKVISLPEKMDPADCFQPLFMHSYYPILEEQVKNPKDGVEYYLDYLQDSNWDKENFIDKAKPFINSIANATYQEVQRKICAKSREIDIKLLAPEKKKPRPEEFIVDEESDMNKRLANYKWLTGEKKNELLNFHFTMCENPKYSDFGYWFMEKGYNIQKLTNFIIKPLFTINDQDKKCEIIEIVNRRGSQSIEMPQGSFTSLQKFESQLWSARCVLEGNFGQGHLRTLNARFINEFQDATIIRNLGMQPEGFWAYADKVWHNGQLYNFDKYGMVEVGDKIFYSPGAAEHNKSHRIDEEGKEFTQGNIYRNDKYFKYQQAEIKFQDWAKQMNLVYQEKAMNAIAYVIFALFKDIVNRYEKTPLLYGYGNAEAGKSAWAERVFYLFFDSKAEPFNLNTGTEFAFFETFSRFYCVPFLFNEFDEDKILEVFFRAFKQAYDNEGRNKGMGQENKTTTQQMNIAPIMIGQVLTTKDGGSVLTRVIPEKFLAKQYTDEEKENFSVLQNWEKKGINSIIIEILEHRGHFKEKFKVTFNEILSKIKRDIRNKGEVFKERIACNHATMLTCAKLIGDKIELGFKFDTYYEYQLESVINLTRLVTESDNLGQFWRIVEYLLERGEITDGYDFRIDLESKIRVNRLVGGKKEDMEYSFDKPTKVLCLRLTTVFPLFQREMKLGTGNKSVNQKTLETYFESNAAFIGVNPSKRFTRSDNKGTVTSSYVFDYDKLGVNLERNTIVEDNRKKEIIIGKVCSEITWIPMGDINMAKFSIVHYSLEGIQQKTITHFTNCFAPHTICPPEIKMNDMVKVEGMLSIDKKGEKEFRQIDIMHFYQKLEGENADFSDDAPF